MKLITNILDLMMNRVFTVKDGRARMFNKIDYVMFPASGIGTFAQIIGEDKGEDYLFSLGYDAGVLGAKEMSKHLGLLGKGVQFSWGIILKMFQTLGFGRMDIHVLDGKKNRIFLDLYDNPVIDFAAKQYGKKSHVCAFYRGIFSAHGEHELQIKGTKLVETECKCKGREFCQWSYNYFDKKKNN